MRFVANLGNWDESIMLIPGRPVRPPGSKHYTDQFPYWYEGRPIYQPFSDAAQAASRKHPFTLMPAP